MPDTAVASLSGLGDWQMLAASVRGRAHAAKQGQREDSFQLACAAGWNLLALADGASPVMLPQQGSNIAVTAAMSELVIALWEQPEPAAAFDWLPTTLVRACTAARAALNREAERRNLNVRNLDTTLLLLAHHAASNLVGAVCVGDGLVATLITDGRHAQLCPISNPIRHLTSTDSDYWRTCVSVYNTWESPPRLFILASDGIANDYPPYTDKLGGFLRELDRIAQGEAATSALHDLISYEAGSDDDRSVAIIQCTEQRQ